MRNYLLPILFLFICSNLWGQSSDLWSPIEESQIPKVGTRHIKPQKYLTLQLNLANLRKKLAQAPMTQTTAVKDKPCIIDIPWPDGRMLQFQIIESPIMESGLQRKFPAIKTYAGAAINDNSKYIRLDFTPQGFHAMVLTAGEGTVYIDPYSHRGGDLEHYICYYKKDFIAEEEQFVCDVQSRSVNANKIVSSASRQFGSCELRTYRLALAATGEYTQFHGGTVALAQAAQVTTMNRVNGVYERDMAIRMNIVSNNNLIIYTNASSDPYTNGSPGNMINENQTNCNNVIGSGSYDIGHVFGTNSGGLAGLGVVCVNNQKARGVTGSASPVGDPFDIDYVAHEMGHQFGANHTQYNNCNRNNATAMEPGSASTIMGYAGICNPNVQSNSDDHFHGISLQEISNHILSTSCPVTTTLSNSAPTISGTNGGVTIPASTPFALTATATDPNANTLSYCWEQMDNTGNATQPPVSTNTEGPNFRSLSPSTSPTRYFPNLTDLAAGVSPTWEVLSSVSRTMNFRVTVRDNAAGGGCTDHTDVTVSVDPSSGPFVVTYPTATGISWNGLATETVTWNVANTDVSPVSCANVDILLSTDGGQTFPTVLASNVPNTGSYAVTVPNTPTTTARIMVICSNGTFFDISDNNFTIVAATNDYTLGATSDTAEVCQPNNATYTINVGNVGTFNNAVTLSASGLPAGASASFSPSSVTPTGSSTLTISNLGSVAVGSYNFTVTGNSTTGTKNYPLVLIVNSPPSAATLTTPTNGATGVSTGVTFTWTDGGTPAETYDIDIATDAGFSTIIDNATNLPSTNYVSSALSSNTTYYWRIRVNNGCGISAYSSTFSFTTSNCTIYMSTNVPQAISASGTPTITSTVNVPVAGTITDVNVVDLSGTHTWVSDLTVSLESPATTSVQLFSGICGSDNDFDLEFDDAGAATIPCPPTTGLSYQPSGSLASFNNESPTGTWTLTVSDGANQDGGDLLTWGVEVCATPPVAEDAGISAFITPQDSIATCDNPITPEVTLTNYGTVPLTTVTINYNINGGPNNTFNWTGSLAVGNSTNVILNPITAPTPAPFTIYASTSNPNGVTDGDISNDTSSVYSQINTSSAIPYTEDFEAGSLPTDITITEQPTSGPLWTYRSAVSAYGTGNGCMELDNFNTDTRNTADLANLPWLDFSSQTDVEFTFDVAYARYDGTYNDTLAIYVSDDCGQSYTLVYKKGGTDLATTADNTNAFTPTNSEWRNDTIDLSAYDGKSHVRVVMVNEGGWGNFLFVDNINIAASNPCNLTASIASQGDVNCTGDSDGDLTISASNGTPNYTYDIGSGPQSNNTFNNLAANSYTVTVSDAVGCSVTVNATISEPAAALLATANTNNISCNGSNDGSTTITALGGTASYTYDIGSGNQSNATFNNLSQGSYTITVTDANGCTATATTMVTEPSLLTASIASSNDPSCFNTTDGDITATASGGTTNYTYNIGSGNQSNGLFNGLTGGNYTVTVTDANGCTATASTTLSTPSSISSSTSVGTAISCAGGANGTATVSASGGAGGFTYLWSNGQGGNTATALAANTYNVTITDANNCSITDNITLTAPATLNASAAVSSNYNGTDISCFGNSDGAVTATASGGTGSLTYLWNNNQITSNISGLSNGIYTVTVTDGNGCTTVASATVTQPTLVSYSNSSNNSSCNGGSNGTGTITPTGGTTPYAYSWSNGQTTATATGLSANSYGVTASDANGCSVSTTININEPNPFVVSSSATDVNCFGDNDGTVTVYASGSNGGYTYDIGTGSQSNSTFNNLSAGNYTVTISDAFGCTTTTSVTISQPASALGATVADNGNGSATATASGGTMPYSYQWDASAGAQTTTTATGLVHNGTYTVTVTDANGCTTTDNVTININGLSDLEHINSFAIVPNPNNGQFQINITFDKQQTGYLQVTNVLGQELRRFNFDGHKNVQVPIDIQQQASGVYFVVLHTANNKAISRKITVTK